MNKTRNNKKKYSPDYIQVNGAWYEKISNASVNVELDLSEDVLQNLDELIEDGQFISRGDAIRTILRKKIEDLK